MPFRRSDISPSSIAVWFRSHVTVTLAVSARLAVFISVTVESWRVGSRSSGTTPPIRSGVRVVAGDVARTAGTADDVCSEWFGPFGHAETSGDHGSEVIRTIDSDLGHRQVTVSLPSADPSRELHPAVVAGETTLHERLAEAVGV